MTDSRALWLQEAGIWLLLSLTMEQAGDDERGSLTVLIAAVAAALTGDKGSTGAAMQKVLQTRHARRKHARMPTVTRIDRTRLQRNSKPPRITIATMRSGARGEFAPS